MAKNVKNKFLKYVLFSIVFLLSILFGMKLLTGKSLDEGTKGPSLQKWHENMGDQRH